MSGKKKPTRACLIVNARSSDNTLDLDDVLLVLLAQGWKVDVREKREKGEAGQLARSAAEDGHDVVVNCGGDGTLNEIVDALVGTPIAVGTIPGGTENVWSKQIGVAQRSRVAAMQLASGRLARVDVGRVSVNGSHAQHFLMMAGLGADGAVIERVSRSLKNKLGPLAVGVAAVEALPSLHAAHPVIEMDGVQWSGRVSQLLVSNIRLYGGFTTIATNAYVDDGLLDVCLFTTDGLMASLRQLTTLTVRRHPDPASAEAYRAASVTVRHHAPLPAQIDGSTLEHNATDGPVDYTFSVLPQSLTVVVPPAGNGAIFVRGLDGAPALNGHKHTKKRPKH